MTATPWLWAVFTVAAAFAQTIRNAMQRELTASLGTVGATQVRFLFGFPFALIFFAVLLVVTGAPVPRPGFYFWPWVAAGAFIQIAATIAANIDGVTTSPRTMKPNSATCIGSVLV